MLEKDQLRYRHAAVNYDISPENFSSIEGIVAILEPLRGPHSFRPEGPQWIEVEVSMGLSCSSFPA